MLLAPGIVNVRLERVQSCSLIAFQKLHLATLHPSNKRRASGYIYCRLGENNTHMGTFTLYLSAFKTFLGWLTLEIPRLLHSTSNSSVFDLFVNVCLVLI